MIKSIGFTAIAVLALSMAAQAADSFVGKWEWNKAKSKFSGPELVAATLVMKARPDGGRTLNLIDYAKDGTTVTWNYSCSDDGKECPAKVSDGAYDTVSVKRVDAQKVIVVMTQKGSKYSEGQETTWKRSSRRQSTKNGATS